VLGVMGGLGEAETSTGKMMGALREAASGKGNFGVGSLTAAEARSVGEAWVGEGATTASDGTTMVSKDGLRQFRPPSMKPNLGRVQANLEARPQANGAWQSNAHIDIVP
jgi:filamentous hemagglutinin